MADIFLSYANEDRETARAVAGLLESAGWTVWWDRRIPAGRTWRSVIEEALREMRCMVVLWSANSVESDWVKEEAEEGRGMGKLIPVMIESVKPPVGFRSIQAADLTDWNGSSDSLGARQLLADLEAVMGKPARGGVHEPEDARDRPISTASAQVGRARASSGVQNDSSAEFLFKRAPGWKIAAALVSVIVLVLGWFLWGDKESPQVSETKSAAISTEPVAAPPSLASLEVSADRRGITTDETINIVAKGRYSDGTAQDLSGAVDWISSDPRVATIDSQGRVTARHPGQTTIAARYGGVTSPSWELEVRSEKPPTKAVAAPALLRLALSAESREMNVRERLPLRAKATYSNGAEKGVSGGIEWRSSDPSVASVNSRGELWSLRPGRVAVIARSGEVESSPLVVIVKDMPRQTETEAATATTTNYRSPVAPAKPSEPAINVGPYLSRAKTHRIQGNYTAALAELEKAQALDPARQEVRDEIETTRQACNAEKRLGRGGLIC
jgi:TIR domain/Bacterial Ig-like domain (group 2)